ncbi:YhdP family protein [Shewanella waksmanii]|uniref:YhdP family protein n=1 Tax=Shewanella waksmanii TaxID=213783 RepID=UPI003736F03B
MALNFCPKTFGRLCWQTLAIILVLFALVVSLIRGLLPKLDDVRYEVINYIEQQYQVEIQLDKLAAEWQAYGPALTMKRIVIPHQERIPVTAVIDNVHIKLDFWQTLLTAQPQIETVIFDGLHVALDIDQLSRKDAGQSEPQSSESNIDWLYALLLEQLDRFSISDASLQLLSRHHDFRPIYIKNLFWRNQDGRHQGRGEVYLDEQASSVEQLSMDIDIKGNGYQPDSLVGQVYLAANALDVGEWASRQEDPYDKNSKLQLEGVVNLEAWLSLANRHVDSAMVAFKPSWLEWHLVDKPQKIEVLKGSLHYLPQAHGWQVQSQDLSFATNGKPWPTLDLVFNSDVQGTDLLVNQISLDGLLPLLPLVPAMQPASLQAWHKAAPQGMLKQIHLQSRESQPSALSLSVEQLAWQHVDAIPGIAPIDLDVVANTKRVIAKLPQQALTVDFGEGFVAPLNFLSQATAIEYDVSGGALIVPQLALENDDVKFDISAKLDLQNAAYLNLLADVAIKDAANAGRYYPLKGMSDSLVNYLNGALLSGNTDNAKVIWRGALSDFPYRQQQGIFQAGFTLQQAEFQFQPSWPAVTDLTLDALFENAAMDLWVKQGQLMDVSAAGTYVGIPEMNDKSLLAVKADIATSGTAATEVLLNSPLRDNVGSTLKVVQIQGDIDGHLDLSIPLYDGAEEVIAGNVNFDSVPVYISEPGVQLDEVTGRVDFINEVVVGEQISALLYQQPVTLNFDTERVNKNYGLNLDLNGEWQVDKLPEILSNPLSPYYQGQFEFDGAMTLIFDETGYRIQAQVNSDLVDTELLLPGEFYKAADTPTKLSAELIGDNKQSSLGIRLSDQMEFWGGFDEVSGNHLGHFDILLGRLFKPGDKLSRDKGRLQLDLEQANFDAWLPIINAFTTQSNNIPTAAVDDLLSHELQREQRSFFPPLMAIDAEIGKLDLMGQPFTDLSFNATPTVNAWRFDGISDEFEGRIDFYPDWSTQGLKIVAKRFDVAPVTKTAENRVYEHNTVMQNMPPLAADVDEFSMYGKPLGHLVLQGTPEGENYRIQTLSITTDDSQLRGDGTWTLADGQNRTGFNLTLTADKFDVLSERLGIDPGLKEAPVDVKASLGWQGAPYAFSLATLDGKIEFDLGKGHLSEVSDKGARIFSLFSLDSLLRRLSLDFSDVFGKGLYFNDFSGTLDIDQGVIKTTDTQMNAVAGTMRVRGYTDLTTESLNYDIRFAPQLGSSVPTVVLLSTGGWTLGLGAFALTKVLEPVIEVISEIRFRLTGTMSEPKLEELERKSKEIEIPESALPKASGVETNPAQPPASPLPSSTVEPANQGVETQPASGVELPEQQIEAMPQFDDKVVPIDPKATVEPEPSSIVPPAHAEPQDESQSTSVSKQSRRQQQSGLYQIAA